MTPLKESWMELYKPITENLKLDMRMNLKTKKVRIAAARGAGGALCGAGADPWRRGCWAGVGPRPIAAS
jgi:hypothetical protein